MRQPFTQGVKRRDRDVATGLIHGGHGDGKQARVRDVVEADQPKVHGHADAEPIQGLQKQGSAVSQLMPPSHGVA